MPDESDYDPRPYIAAATWTFAKSEPVHRHWYVIAAQSPDLDAHYEMARWINRVGRWETFEGYGERDPNVKRGRWKYAYCDGYDYWTSGPKGSILNRREANPPEPAETQLRLDGC